MSEDQLENEVRQCLDEWEQARQEHDEIRREYITTGPLLPGQAIRWPEKMLNAEGWEKLEQAAEKEKSAGERWNDAIARWRSSG